MADHLEYNREKVFQNILKAYGTIQKPRPNSAVNKNVYKKSAEKNKVVIDFKYNP